MELLRVEHVQKSFGKNHVLKDISLDVKKNEVVSIIGPSGSGKSTLLRCITLLERVNGGSIYIGDDAMVEDSRYAPDPVLRKLRLRLGLVFQNFNLFPHFSVLRNLTEAQVHVAGISPEAARETAMELLSKMGIADKADEYPYALSGGQCQRVAIARAIVNNPKILLADEPTGALDSQSGAQIMELFQTLNDEGVTVVMITHDIDVANHAKRVLHIRDGQFAEQHIPEEKEAEA